MRNIEGTDRMRVFAQRQPRLGWGRKLRLTAGLVLAGQVLAGPVRAVLVLAVLVLAGLVLMGPLLAVPVWAQAPDASLADPPKVAPPPRSIEDLNLVAADASMPTFADSFVPVNSRFRQSMYRHGMTLRLITQQQYSQNTIAAPVTPDAQTYIGQYPFEDAMLQPILVADLRQLHLHRTQLYVGGVWNWVSWNPAGPKSFQLWNLYAYKAWGHAADGPRMQTKAGYVSLNLEFVGLFVGGSTATGGQGVYAVLPYEVGMSYFPLTAPAVLARIQGPGHSYLKLAAQRSIDAGGGPAEVARNGSGLRFDPHGDKVLAIGEAGYLRNATRESHEAWLRTGFMRNWTPFRNLLTNQKQSGNYCAYLLMDAQLKQTSEAHPDHGIYAGASFMTVPDTLNTYSRYYELRAYKEAPFESRPSDLVSIVASHTSYSRLETNQLLSSGRTAWRSGSTLTASYALHASPGNFLGFGLTYLHGPAVTPRSPSALTFLASWTTYF